MNTNFAFLYSLRTAIESCNGTPDLTSYRQRTPAPRTEGSTPRASTAAQMLQLPSTAVAAVLVDTHYTPARQALRP